MVDLLSAVRTSADDSGGVDGGWLDESTSERRMYYLSTDI